MPSMSAIFLFLKCIVDEYVIIPIIDDVACIFMLISTDLPVPSEVKARFESTDLSRSIQGCISKNNRHSMRHGEWESLFEYVF
jgi:hypothetical protein